MSEETSKSSSVPIDTWISGPVHLEALTRNSEGQDFGVLLRFLDREGNSRLWAMPFIDCLNHVTSGIMVIMFLDCCPEPLIRLPAVGQPVLSPKSPSKG